MFNPIEKIRKIRQQPSLAKKNRASFTNDQWKGFRLKFVAQTSAGGLAFMLWFLACCSYLFGTLYLSPIRHDHFHVLAVDYDGGVVGKALAAAYQQLEGPTFIKLITRTPEEFPTEADMYHAVWDEKYWASIAITKGASERLSAAIQGGEAAATYNPSDALHYVWNQQRYTAFSNSIVLGAMQQLVTATRLAYDKMNGTQAARFLNTTDPAAVQSFMNPISATATNIQAATLGTVILFNTVAMAMPVLQQFFFLLVLNGVAAQHQLYLKMTVRSSLIVRRVAGVLFTFGAALCQTGYFWAFRENWHVNGNQFVLTWMVFWLLMHIHLLILDTISTVAPLPVMPFVVLLWVFLNLASTLSPLEMQAGFYHWGIALPGHNSYSLLITIWTGGSGNRAYRALPIMFAWWVVANITTSLTHYRACHLAYKFNKEQEERDESTDETPAKDEEEAIAEPEARPVRPSMSRRTTLAKTTSRLDRQMTAGEIATEQRIVYGPSVPPLA